MIKILTSDMLKFFEPTTGYNFYTDVYPAILVAKDGKFELKFVDNEFISEGFYFSNWTKEDNFKIKIDITKKMWHWNQNTNRESHRRIYPIYDWLKQINKIYKDSILNISTQRGNINYGIAKVFHKDEIIEYTGDYLEMMIEDENVIAKFYCLSLP